MPGAAYHYVRSNASAGAQVAKVASVVPKNVPVIPDVEENSGTIGLTREFVAKLRAAGFVVPLLYLPQWYWKKIGSPSLAGLPPLWSSRYPDNIAGTIGDEFADVPASHWQGYGGLPVALLQFTSSAIGSWKGKVDANAYRGTRAQLASLLAGKPREDGMGASETALLKRILAVVVESQRRFTIGMASAQKQLATLVAGEAKDLTAEQVERIVSGTVEDAAAKSTAELQRTMAEIDAELDRLQEGQQP